jgi:uncharacterized alpha-E superfamily protein
MSVEMWETVNDTWLWLSSRPRAGMYQRERDAFYSYLAKQCMLIHGVCYSTMLHEEPFLFMRLGRRGRARRTDPRASSIVKHHSLGDERRDESTAEAAQWLAILRSCNAVDAFFQRSANVLTGPAVAEFLLFDRAFPRAVLYNLDNARDLLGRPARERRSRWPARRGSRLERLRGSLLADGRRRRPGTGPAQPCSRCRSTTPAGVCEAIHSDYLGPPTEELLRGARAHAQRGARRAGRRITA